MPQKLLLQFLMYVLLDSGILKKMFSHSTRDFWYIGVIFILVISAVNLSVQQTLMNQQNQTIIHDCDFLVAEIESVPPPLPKTPPLETKPPAMPADRRQHDLRRLLNSIE